MKIKIYPTHYRNPNIILIKKYGLGLQGPVTPDNKKYQISLRDISELIGDVTGVSKFSAANHLLALREERRDG